jgi:hypothetical protein
VRVIAVFGDVVQAAQSRLILLSPTVAERPEQGRLNRDLPCWERPSLLPQHASISSRLCLLKRVSSPSI